MRERTTGQAHQTEWDLRWLSAPDDAVAAAMANLRRSARPAWVPTRRQMLVHVDHCLILWYLFFAFMTLGIRVDSYQGGTVDSADVRDLVVSLLILAAWLYGTMCLHRWAARPPSPRSRMQDWRRDLTALANGFESRPAPSATFSALLTAAARSIREYPRFVAPGVEFGRLVRRAGRSTEWQYLVAKLPAPLPHLVLEATANDRFGRDLAADVERDQRLSLEGDFDRWFQVFTPAQYRADALYVLTPDLMAALIDVGSAFSVEIIDDTVIFSASPAVDFHSGAHWDAIRALLTTVVPMLRTKASRYYDERVPGQEVPRVLARLRAERLNPETPWVAPVPRIGTDGRRLDLHERRRGFRVVMTTIGWLALLAFLYVFPGLFAFAGFMSVIDGR